MDSGRITPKALCVIRRAGQLLVFEGSDSVRGDCFYRPLGGAIEFGEHSKATAAREMSEELDTEVHNLRCLGMLESIFTLDGEQGHEIVMLYEGDFADQAMYDRDSIFGHEDDGETFTATWKPVDDFRTGKCRLIPESLLELLNEKYRSSHNLTRDVLAGANSHLETFVHRREDGVDYRLWTFTRWQCECHLIFEYQSADQSQVLLHTEIRPTPCALAW